MHTASYIPPAELIGPTSPGPELRAVAITTLAGAAATEGTSHNLGNQADTDLLLGLRAWADCILVGAKTVRAEGYGAPTTPIAVPSRSFDFDTSTEFFTEATHSPVILAPTEALNDPGLEDRRQALVAAGATLLDTGAGTPADLVRVLRERGYTRITCEGGPGIYSMMFNADLVDVFHVTVDPLVHGPVDKHLLAHRPDGHDFSHRLVLEDARATDDSLLFLRYRRVR